MNTSDERVWESSDSPERVYPTLDDYSRALLRVHFEALPPLERSRAELWERKRPVLNSFGFWSDALGRFQMREFWTPKSEQH